MKSTGKTKSIDSLGRIVIPKDIRKMQNIKEKDQFEIYTEADYIIIKKIESNCIFCSEIKNLFAYKDKKICKSCMNNLSKKVKGG